jgi:hypothetical protein
MGEPRVQVPEYRTCDNWRGVFMYVATADTILEMLEKATP